MGWDAFAMKDGDSVYMTGRSADAFVRAATTLRAEGLVIDFMLPHGGLDVSMCGHMLQMATRASVFTEDWTAAQTRRYAATADWSFTVPSTEEWAKRSARAFLDACVEAGCGVRFSW